MDATVVQLGAGALMIDSIRALRAGGFRVHALDGDPRAPGLAHADAGAAIDFADPEAVSAYAQRVDADLILGLNEPGAWSAAVASDRLGLPGVPPAVAWRCAHKGAMRRAWARAGLRQPAFRILERLEEVGPAFAALGAPAILKPAIGWGSRGVRVLRTGGDLEAACAAAGAHAARLPGSAAMPHAAGRWVIERLAAGRQLSVEGLVGDGRARILTIGEETLLDDPRVRVTMTLAYPADLEPSSRAVVERAVTAALEALGLRRGAFHAQCLLDAGEVSLIELAARGGGGHIFGRIVAAVSGVAMPAALARLWLGAPPPSPAAAGGGACYRFFALPAGALRAVHGLERVRAAPGVLDAGVTWRPGRRAAAITSGAERPGFVVTAGRDRRAAERRAERALEHLRFELEEVS